MKKSQIYILLVLLIAVSACQSGSESRTEDQTSAEMQEAAILKHYQQQGDSLIDLAQAELLNNVSDAMLEGGPENAVSFCNIHASTIVSDLAEQWNCTLRRTSLLARNPDHMPTEDEMNILNWYAGLGEEALVSTVWRDGDIIHYASPIRVQMTACLSCHGSYGEDISEATAKIIAENYPSDKAIDYELGDLRGMWHLTFTTESIEMAP